MSTRSKRYFKKAVKKMKEIFPEFNELNISDEECFAFWCAIVDKRTKVIL